MRDIEIDEMYTRAEVEVMQQLLVDGGGMDDRQTEVQHSKGQAIGTARGEDCRMPPILPALPASFNQTGACPGPPPPVSRRLPPQLLPPVLPSIRRWGPRGRFFILQPPGEPTTDQQPSTKGPGSVRRLCTPQWSDDSSSHPSPAPPPAASSL